MRSDTTQLDILRDDQQRIVGAWMAAAETALHDRQFAESERQRRHDYYMAEAKRLEAKSE